ncbi:MAG: YggU family protein [Acidobacteria bacterium]|nr:YggU family protein [Acidobacteriota bacterium]
MNGNELIIGVRVVPRASRSEIVGLHDGALKVRIAAPPVDGAANAELVKVLAKAFSVPKSNVEILIGGSSKTKRVRILGANESAIQSVLRP